MMTKCRVEKRIWWDTEGIGGFTCVAVEMEVLDAPQRGGELRAGRWFSGRLTQVMWNVDDARYSCRVADELPDHDGALGFSHDFLVANALQEGWRLCEVQRVE